MYIAELFKPALVLSREKKQTSAHGTALSLEFPV